MDLFLKHIKALFSRHTALISMLVVTDVSIVCVLQSDDRKAGLLSLNKNSLTESWLD